MIRVLLPFHLRTLAHCASEIKLDVEMPITPITVIDALEKKYPALRGAILEHESRQRRPKIHFRTTSPSDASHL
jgi:sulfur-carrier protein